MNKTFSQKPAEVTRRWVVIDADQIPLGRLSTEVSKYLTGKYKPTFTPHVDGGDHVIVINADKIALSGTKMDDKVYYRHSQYPGSLKQRTAKEQIKLKSSLVITHAVKGMIPKNKLAANRLARLKVYSGAEHSHEAQKPERVEVK